jgi:ribosome-binding protein aMBF1 (putative translation factor)
MVAMAQDMARRVAFELHVRRVSTSQLAQLLGHDVKTIRRRLRGETDWHQTELVAIADYLDIPVGQLTGSIEP